MFLWWYMSIFGELEGVNFYLKISRRINRNFFVNKKKKMKVLIFLGYFYGKFYNVFYILIYLLSKYKCFNCN